MTFSLGQSVQISQPFQDRQFSVRAWEQGRVKKVSPNGNVHIDFGDNRAVTFLPNELQAWLRPVAAAQPVYAANTNVASQVQPSYVQKPAYAASPQQPMYVAPPSPKPDYQAPSQPYQPPKPQQALYQSPRRAGPTQVNAAEVAAEAVERYTNEQETKETENSFPMRGNLNVRVGGCKKLPGVDMFGGCDPYVKVIYGPIFRRTAKKKSKNPEFNEMFNLPIDEERYLVVEVWDWNKIGKDLKMFTLPLPFHGLMQYGFKQRHEFALSEKARISLDLTYIPNYGGDFKEREEVVVQFNRKPFGLQLGSGPNGTGAKVVGFTNDTAERQGAKMNMYITQINGVSVIGTKYKVVMKLLSKASKNSVLNFADLRLNAKDDTVSI